MFIKKIIIDGFKSYAQRTEVGPFDPQFNAITGLNGSGKSNILDSICFLLGISNLSQVRAGSLQELVYKGGQAGVIKATVTITFDNTDKHQSPVGYDSFDEITVSRQVVIGGRNKYLINGSNALPSRVQDLFRSVQLNVNNPHFLIMQGRITKVLNMKPPEILSMIEEAAGTRMYENKREAAQKTIEKKDSKLAEIDKILTEEITPTLKKLKEERSSYLEYQKVTRELEHLSRLLVAYHFTQAEEQRKQSALDLEEAKLKIKQLKENAFQVDETISEVMRTLDELRQQKQREESDGPLQELEKKVDQSSKLVAVAEATLKDSKQQLSSEKKSYQEIMKSLKEDEDLLEKKTSEISSCQDSYQTLQQRLQDSQKALVTAQQHFQAVSSGLSSSVDGQSDTLAAQKIAKENEISAAQTQIKQAEMRLKSMKAELKEKEKASSSSEHVYTKDKTAYDNLKKEIAKLDSSLSKLQYQEGHLENLMEKKDNLKSEIAELRAKVDHLESRFPHLQFDYSDPHTGFDRSKVKGPVAKVLHVNDVSAATALEVTAGGKLYHVIVDTEETGKQLLQNGKLKRRYTIIPLNKITARCIANDVVKRAQQIVGSDKVRPALSLVDYDSDVQPAMKYVFGTTFVCNTLQDAKQVTFDKRIMTRSVALAGDVFDPSGTLTGGSRAERSTILVKLQELKECEDCLQLKLSSLAQLEKEIKQVEKIAHKYTQMKDELESKHHDAELIWARVEQSTYHQQLMQVEQLKESIESQQDIISQAKDVETKAMKQLQEIEHKIENSKGLRDQELKDAEEILTKAKMEADKVAEEARTNNQGMEGLQLEVVELESSISSQKMQVESTLQAVDKIQSKVSQNEEALTKAKDELASAVNELNEYKAVLRGRNKELQQHEKHLKELESQRSQCTLAIKENEHKMSSCQRDSREADKKVDSLVTKYDWIATDKQYFGQPNTAYDFKTTDPREAEKKTNKLQEQKEKLSRHVNMRAMNMLGKAEEKYNDLMRKKKIVENDKSKIAELIAELDQKKNEALQTAWKRVNQDFGSIFSTLLPGTSAKLSPPQGQSVLDGLEVKVAFGDVWKESLSELSGGQKSLVALSLILSLLLFKPAPLYILDEVDAALDLSHTQNIGQMLRTHFHHSQFIVVSLKNGMFNNANVLFKTKFVDGISTVTRYENPKLHSNKENDGQEHSSRKALKS